MVNSSVISSLKWNILYFQVLRFFYILLTKFFWHSVPSLCQFRLYKNIKILFTKIFYLKTNSYLFRELMTDEDGKEKEPFLYRSSHPSLANPAPLALGEARPFPAA